jgi:hypothetical protein
MKFTEYFKYRRTQPDREWIEVEWIKRVIDSPEHQTVQDDGPVRLWARIEEANNKWLRVVVLEDGETVHNAFFDRSFHAQ